MSQNNEVMIRFQLIALLALGILFTSAKTISSEEERTTESLNAISYFNGSDYRLLIARQEKMIPHVSDQNQPHSVRVIFSVRSRALLEPGPGDLLWQYETFYPGNTKPHPIWRVAAAVHPRERSLYVVVVKHLLQALTFEIYRSSSDLIEVSVQDSKDVQSIIGAEPIARWSKKLPEESSGLDRMMNCPVVKVDDVVTFIKDDRLLLYIRRQFPQCDAIYSYGIKDGGWSELELTERASRE